MARRALRGVKQPHPLGSVASRVGVSPLTVVSVSSASTGVKISELPAASSASDTDQIEVNQAGTSRRITVDQIIDQANTLVGTYQVFIADNDASTSISVALESAWAAAAGKPVWVPKGNYRQDAAATHDAPVSMTGVGMGAAAGATTNTETSQFVVYSSTAYAIDISSIYGSTFEGLKFNVEPTFRPSTDGGGINLDAGGSGGTQANTRIRNCAFVSPWIGVAIFSPTYPVIEGCYFETWLSSGVRFATAAGVEGSGGWIRNNYFFGDAGADSTAGPAVYSEVGYLEVSSNLILGARYGVHFKPTNNPAGSLQIFDNHIEEQELACVYCEYGDSVAAMLQICRNEFSTIDHGDSEFLGTIVLKSDGGGAWLTDVQIEHNVIRNATTSSSWFIDAETGTNMAICNNQIEGLALNAGNGIRVGAQAVDVLVSQNKFSGTIGTKYSLTAECTLVDTLNDLTFAEVNAITCKDGSFVWCSDALAGANPAAGSGSGAFLQRIGGAWVTAPTLQAVNKWTATQYISGPQLIISPTGSVGSGASGLNLYNDGWISISGTSDWAGLDYIQRDAAADQRLWEARAFADGSYRITAYSDGGTAQFSWIFARAGGLGLPGIVTALSGTAIAAGSNTQAFIKGSAATNLGIYYGTGDPTFSAAKGSLYSKVDATTTTTRLWVNTNGSTTWANFTSSA